MDEFKKQALVKPEALSACVARGRRSSRSGCALPFSDLHPWKSAFGGPDSPAVDNSAPIGCARGPWVLCLCGATIDEPRGGYVWGITFLQETFSSCCSMVSRARHMTRATADSQSRDSSLGMASTTKLRS